MLRGGVEVLGQHGGQGHICKKVVTSQESLRVIQLLRAHNQRNLILKVKMDKNVLFKLILFRFFSPLTVDLNMPRDRDLF